MEFEHNLESELADLHKTIAGGTYFHGGYRHMIVNENKRRDIAVAGVRDRVVHRLLYDYLVPIYDKGFDYDVWSCRAGKGLTAAVDRTQQLLQKYPSASIWRGDVVKFFDHVDHDVLRVLLERKIDDKQALNLLNKVIDSYNTQRGIPIGNLTSQVFANIYLNQFDRFVRTQLKPLAYVRYGDDFLLFLPNRLMAELIRKQARQYLSTELGLSLHVRNDVILQAHSGVNFLGVQIFANGRRLLPRMEEKIASEISLKNFTGYSGLLRKHGSAKQQTRFLYLPDDFMV